MKERQSQSSIPHGKAQVAAAVNQGKGRKGQTRDYRDMVHSDSVQIINRDSGRHTLPQESAKDASSQDDDSEDETADEKTSWRHQNEFEDEITEGNRSSDTSGVYEKSRQGHTSSGYTTVFVQGWQRILGVSLRRNLRANRAPITKNSRTKCSLSNHCVPYIIR